MVLYAGNVGMIIIAPVKLHMPGGVQDVNLRNQLLQVLYFTIANFLFIKLFILHTMYAKVKKIYHLMSLPAGYHSGK